MNRPQSSPRTRLSLAMLSVLALPTQALAQNATTDSPSLEAVVVTGQSRSQALQNVPIAIAVVTPEQMRNLGSANIADMNGYVPGLNIDAHQATQPKFYLRGIGSEDFLIGTDSPVGIYVDGVYTGKTGGALLNFNDVRRVEVLKGPQGTLFGRNSAGGAISVVTNQPSANFSASGSLRLGNQGARHAALVLNQPLNDDWAFRMSAVGQFSDGFIRDAVTGQAYGGKGAWGTRMALRWSDAERSSAMLAWEHEELDQSARMAIGLQATASPGGANPQSYFDPRTAPLKSDVPDNRETRRFNGLTLRLAHSFTWAEFNATTAYRHFSSLNRQDTDGTNNIATQLATTNAEGNTSWQQEFKLSGRNEQIDWVAGLSLFKESATQASEVNTCTDSMDTFYSNLSRGQLFPFGQLTGVAQQMGIPGINLMGLPWQETMFNVGGNRAQAVYGDAIWHLSPATNLTGGVRFTHDEKTFSWRYPARIAASLDTQLALLKGFGLFQNPQLGALYQGIPALGFNGVANNVPLVLGEATRPAPFQVARSWNNVSPRLVIDHKLNPATMLYGSVTKGYQSGGFTGLASNGAYEPEFVTNFELGVKGQLPASGLQYSAALFRYGFRNLQNLELVGTGADGFPKYVTQTSNQKAWGLDTDAQWKLSRQLRLFGTLAYIDQTYGDYQRRHKDAAGRDVLDYDLAGQAVGTPSLSASAGIDFSWQAAGGAANAVLQAAYTGAIRCNDYSKTQTTCLRTPTFTVGAARTRVDARLGWDSAKRHGNKQWGVALVVNNLLNKRYIGFVENTITAPLGVAYGEPTAPRTIGIEFRATL